MAKAGEERSGCATRADAGACNTPLDGTAETGNGAAAPAAPGASKSGATLGASFGATSFGAVALPALIAGRGRGTGTGSDGVVA